MLTLRRHGRWLVIAVVLIAVATLALYRSVRPRYTAKASLWLDHRLDDDVAAGGDASATSVATRRNTEIRFLTSPDLAARVTDKLGLAAVSGVGQPDASPALSIQDARRRAIAALVNQTKVIATGASYAVVVDSTARDPVVATAITNQLVDQYVASRREAEQHSKAVDQARSELGAAHDEVIRTTAVASAFRAAVDAFAHDAEAQRLRDEVASLQAELSAERRRNDSGVADPTLAKDASKLRDLRAQVAQLSAERPATRDQSGGSRSDNAAADARIAQLRRRIATASKQIRDAAAQRTAGQHSQEDDALKRRNAERLRNLDGAARTAERRAESSQDQLGRLLAARPSSAGAYVIARATVPTTRDFPQPWAFAIGGLLAALAAAGLIICGRDLLAPGLRTRRSAERKLGLPVIGMVPDTRAVLDSRDAWITPIDLVVAQNTSSFRAAFRAILLGLDIGSGGKSPRSIVISSAVAEEGKTTVAIGLARTAALVGLRVLFIDCDVRLPAASRMIAPDQQFGLMDVLEGKVELKQALTRDIPSGAWVLSSRENSAAANGLVGSEAMKRLIRAVSASYDLVVLDAAPALALAEAAALASFADATLMIARWRTTPVRATRLAIDTLRDARATVDALVLTRVGA